MQLASHGYKGWVVGGSVRDVLLGRSAHDWDLATDATPVQVQEVFATSAKVIPTGIEHGTVTVRLKKEQSELTTLRGEGAYSDGRRPDEVCFLRSIEEDLRRRDFTVNAIAFDPMDEQVVDPYGGLAALESRMLVAVEDPFRRFSEDGLRIMRAARFAGQLEFAIEPETYQALRQSVGNLKSVSAERLRDELTKMVLLRRPSQALRPLCDFGGWSELLERCRLGGAVASSFEPRAWQDTCLRADELSADLPMQLASLFLALDDPKARPVVAERFARCLRFSKREVSESVLLLRYDETLLKVLKDGESLRRLLLDLGESGALKWLDLHKVALAVRGDARLNEERDRIESALRQEIAASPPLHVADLAVSGAEIMSELSLPAGREVGVLLRRLQDLVLAEPSRNERAALLEVIRLWNEGRV